MKIRELIGLLLICSPFCTFADPIISDLHDEGGKFSMKIDGKQYVALSTAEYGTLLADNERLIDELKATKRLLDKYSALNDQYDELKARYNGLNSDYKKLVADSNQLNISCTNTADKLVALTQDYSKSAHAFDTLAGKYRDIALRTNPREPLDIGVGAVTLNNSTRGLVMVGAGTHISSLSMRGWLMGGQDSYGAMVGISF